MASKRKISTVKPQFGNNRSHSLKATRRQFKPNYQSKRLWVSELDKYVRVKVNGWRTAHHRQDRLASVS